MAGKRGYLDFPAEIDAAWPASLMLELLLHTARQTTIAAFSLIVLTALTRAHDASNLPEQSFGPPSS